MRGLKKSHWGCMHRHRYMAPTPNVNYPLACQTCAREDAEERFRCRFCCSLLSEDHQYRSYQIRPSLRAIPQP
jgi:hypothetical protein